MAIVCVFAAGCNGLGIAPTLFLTVALSWTSLATYFAIKRQFSEAVITLLIGVSLSFLLTPAIMVARDTPRWTYCQYNMSNIALALQQYEINNGTFPPAYIADANGKPMHSWRVLILPYIERQNLYAQYRFDEPWDGPNNSQLHGERVRLYECPSSINPIRTETSYLAVTGPQTIWPGATTTKISDIKDGPGNTIILVEAHNSGIHWMEPRDLDITTMPMTVNSSKGLSISSAHTHHGPFANAAFADGHIQALPNTTPAKSLRAALTISGGEREKLPVLRLRP
jgi:prepilin-type processing-associated H-X9-DG protein